MSECESDHAEVCEKKITEWIEMGNKESVVNQKLQPTTGYKSVEL